MSITKKLAHKAEAVSGATKKLFGRAPGYATRDASSRPRATPNRQGPKPKTCSSTDRYIIN